MTQFYQPPLDSREEDPFVRDGDDKLIRRSYWLDLQRPIHRADYNSGHRHAADRRREAGPSHRYPTAAPDRHHPGTRNPASRRAALTISLHFRGQVDVLEHTHEPGLKGGDKLAISGVAEEL